ncbi:MAG: hypothetical protein QGD94_12300 [Planctomycetia bacterium]|nr:hypothetical protein [Planctomycetia bacterium]
MRLRISLVMLIVFALGSQCLGKAAKSAKAPKLDVKKDYDYTKVLFSVHIKGASRTAKRGLKHKFLQAYVDAYDASFCNQIEFSQTNKTRDALRREAEEKKYGFILEASISKFTLKGKKAGKSRSNQAGQRMQCSLFQQMQMMRKNGWKVMFTESTTSPQFGTGELDLGFGLTIVRNPAEMPFMRMMLPILVTNIVPVMDNTGKTVKSYAVSLKVRNNLMFKVESLTPNIEVPSASRTGKPSYVRHKNPVSVALAPGTGKTFKVQFSANSISKAVKVSKARRKPLRAVARRVVLKIEPLAEDDDDKDEEPAK